MRDSISAYETQLQKITKQTVEWGLPVKTMPNSINDKNRRLHKTSKNENKKTVLNSNLPSILFPHRMF